MYTCVYMYVHMLSHVHHKCTHKMTLKYGHILIIYVCLYTTIIFTLG